MRVRFEEELGIVPVTRRFEADSASMPDALVDQLRRLLENYASQPDPPSPYPDQGSLRVEVEDSRGTTSVNLASHRIPPEAQALFEYFRAQAKPVSSS